MMMILSSVKSVRFSKAAHLSCPASSPYPFRSFNDTISVKYFFITLTVPEKGTIIKIKENTLLLYVFMRGSIEEFISVLIGADDI